MKPAKILKIFKKGAKTASKKKGKAPGGGFKWPAGIRIGVYGHTNSGKTVFFSALNEDCKISKRLQISVTDSETAAEFLACYRQIWGLGTSSTAGTVVDLRGDQKFPEPTESEKILQFNAVLDRSKKVSVVTYDYPGKAVSITGGSDLQEKVVDFMEGADGIIFFFDPKLLGAELESQAHVASFVTMLERLAPLDTRLPIPVALVITKADVLPGFTGEKETVLIGPEDESFLSEDFEIFLDKVLSSNRIASNSEWAGSVRKILVKLKEFLKVVVGRTLDFQIFFISNTGQQPEKIGTDVGRSIYRPPKIIRPIGIQEPFYWILKSVSRSRAISKLRKVTKYVAMLSILWIVLYSIPNLYHLSYMLAKTTRIEDSALTVNPDLTNTQRSQISTAYERYSRSKIVKWFFPQFSSVALRIKEVYDHFQFTSDEERLNETILRAKAIIADTNNWPTFNPRDSALALTAEQLNLETDLNNFHSRDSSSILFRRSDRALGYWNGFKRSIVKSKIDPTDTTVLGEMMLQSENDKSQYASELSDAEVGLIDVLLTTLNDRKVVGVRTVESRQATIAFDEVIENVNGNSSPKYRIEGAVRDLKKIKGKLGAGADKEIGMINRYLKDAKKWTKKRQVFKYHVQTLPDMGVLYIEVTGDGKTPEWSGIDQIFEGDDREIKWKVGDDIYIGFCEEGATCDKGKNPSDQIVLDGKYSIFEMSDLHFEKIDKKVKLRFKPSLEERLPTLK